MINKLKKISKPSKRGFAICLLLCLVLSMVVSFNMMNTDIQEPSFDNNGEYTPNNQDYSKMAYVERTEDIYIWDDASLASFSTSGDGSEGDP